MTRRTLLSVLGASIFAVMLQPGPLAQPGVPEGPVRTTATSPAYQRFLSPASPLELVAAKKVDRIAWIGLRRRQAQRLHGRRPGLQAGAAHELSQRRRHRSLRRQHLRRRIDGDLRARDDGEPRRLGGESERRPGRPRARDLGCPHGRRRRLPRRPRRGRSRARARWQRDPVREGRADISRAAFRRSGPPPRWTAARSRSSPSGACRAVRAGRRTDARSRSSARARITASS